jgi:transposase
MMTAKYRVTLTDDERAILHDVIRAGSAPARKQTHARILLKADASEDGPAWSDAAIRAALDVSEPTIHRVRQTFVEQGLDVALERRKPRRERFRKIDGEAEAHLIALVCQEPCPGHAHWSLRLLADELVSLGYCESLSHETVRQVLKKTS